MTYLTICLFLVFVCTALASVPYRPKTVKGVPCLVPFKYKGEYYQDCIDKGSAKPWCYTSTDGQWNYCDKKLDSSSCDVANNNMNSSSIGNVVEFVNNLRSQVPAARMAKLRWNTELAMRAQFMSDKCDLSNSNQKLCDNQNYMGQFSYYTMSSAPQSHRWVDMIMQFYNKRTSYDIDTDKCTTDSCYGYKQLVSAKTTDIGCAVTSCNRDSIYQDYYFCTFYPPLYTGQKPYETGSEKCQQCYKLSDTNKFRCSGGLCDVCEGSSDGCQGKDFWRQQVIGGAICEDIDPSFCNQVKSHCSVIEQLPANYKDRMKTDCRKSCGLC